MVTTICFLIGDVIHGKLDQHNRHLELDFAIGRDARVSDIGGIVQTLNDWCEACDATLGAVEIQINKANCEKENYIQHRATVEEKISQFKENLKSFDLKKLRVKPSTKFSLPHSDQTSVE